jgi:hypothetical protein
MHPLYQFNSVVGMPINGYVILVKLAFARLMCSKYGMDYWHDNHIIIMIIH